MMKFNAKIEPTIRLPYDGNRFRVSIAFTGPSRTKQAFKDETDINRIMDKYRKTGLVAHLNAHQGTFEDVTNATNYHDAMNTILRAEEAFQGLPAHVRKHFDNDPAQFLEAFHDPERGEELRELGLLETRKEVIPEVSESPVSGSTSGHQPVAESVMPPPDVA